jgi:hypothetical protein
MELMTGELRFVSKFDDSNVDAFPIRQSVFFISLPTNKIFQMSS